MLCFVVSKYVLKYLNHVYKICLEAAKDQDSVCVCVCVCVRACVCVCVVYFLMKSPRTVHSVVFVGKATLSDKHYDGGQNLSWI